MAGPWEDYQEAPQGPWSEFTVPSQVVPTVKQAKDIGDAIIAGVQSSATGLLARGKLPSMQLGEDAPWYHRIAAGVGNIGTDLPLSVVGAAGGAAAMGTAGSVVPVAGTAAGIAVGAGAGAFAAPMAIREALIAAYEGNHAASWEGVWDIAWKGIKGGLKGAAIGGATMGAGRFVGGALGRTVSAAGPVVPLVESKLGQGAAALGAELTTLTTTAAALEGHMPKWQDFMDNAILLGGMKGAVAIAKGMRSTYAETGKLPEQIAADAARDPQIKADLAAGKIPEAYAPLALEQRIQAAIDADPRPEALREMLKSTPEKPFRLGEPPLQDPVKPEYITDRDTLKGVIRGVENLYEPEIQAQTRGVVTNKMTAAQALRDVAGMDVEHAIGTAENATQLYARAHVLKSVLNEAYKNFETLAKTPEADISPAMKVAALASAEKVAMVYAEYRGARAEAGRALQIFQALRRDASLVPEAEAIAKLAERKGSLQDIARAITALKDPAQAGRALSEYAKATTMEKFIEGWKAAILSGPQTHLANISGNLMKWGIELPESTIAATITAARQVIKGDPLTMAQYKARALAPLYGLQLGAVDAIKIAGEVWKQEGMHLEKADVQRPAIEGKKGEIIRIPFKALQSADALFRTVAERAEAHIMAVDRAVKEGYNPNTLEGRTKIVEYTNHPETGLAVDAAKVVIDRIQQAGAEAVFAQRLGPRLESIQRAMQGHWMSFIVPFFRTPANLVSWAVQHVPGLNLMSARWRADWEAGGERQAQAAARVVVGTALATTAFALAEDGTLTGGGLYEKEESRTKKAAGWQPYSIKIGDKYYSYQRIEPVAKVLGIAADTHDMLQALSKNPDDVAKLTSMAVLMFGNATVSTTYLSGLSNAIQSIADPARYGENFLEQYASSLVPKIVGQTVTMIDPYQREVAGTVDAIQSQLPFLREKLMPKRDVWGEKVKGEKLFAVMPIAVTEASQDKVKTEAVRLHLAIADAPKFLTVRGPFGAKERRIDLTEEQRDILKEVSGKWAMEKLIPIVNDPDWKRIPDYAQAGIYKRILALAKTQGAYKALSPEDAQYMKVQNEVLDKMFKQLDEAETR